MVLFGDSSWPNTAAAPRAFSQHSEFGCPLQFREENSHESSPQKSNRSWRLRTKNRNRGRLGALLWIHCAPECRAKDCTLSTSTEESSCVVSWHLFCVLKRSLLQGWRKNRKYQITEKKTVGETTTKKRKGKGNGKRVSSHRVVLLRQPPVIRRAIGDRGGRRRLLREHRRRRGRGA